MRHRLIGSALSVVAAACLLPASLPALAGADAITDAENAFRTQANAICKRGKAAVDAIPEPRESKSASKTAKALRKYFLKALKTIQPYDDQLRALPVDQASDDFKTKVQNLFTQKDAGVASLKKATKELKKGLTSAYSKAYKKYLRFAKAASAIAKQLGLTKCDD